MKSLLAVTTIMDMLIFDLLFAIYCALFSFSLDDIQAIIDCFGLGRSSNFKYKKDGSPLPSKAKRPTPRPRGLH